MSFKDHEKNPANQGFNVTARFNKTKKRAWWQVGKSNNNNKKREG